MLIQDVFTIIMIITMRGGKKQRERIKRARNNKESERKRVKKARKSKEGVKRERERERVTIKI